MVYKVFSISCCQTAHASRSCQPPPPLRMTLPSSGRASPSLLALGLAKPTSANLARWRIARSTSATGHQVTRKSDVREHRCSCASTLPTKEDSDSYSFEVENKDANMNFIPENTTTLHTHPYILPLPSFPCFVSIVTENHCKTSHRRRIPAFRNFLSCALKYTMSIRDCKLRSFSDVRMAK